MSIPLLPRRRLGKWTLAMLAAILLLLAARAIARLATGPDTGAYFFSNPLVETINILIWTCGSAAFLTGVGALSYRDRSLAALVGAVAGFAIFLTGVIRMMSPP